MFPSTVTVRFVISSLMLLAVTPVAAEAQSVDFVRATSRPSEAKPEAIGLNGVPFYAPKWPAEYQSRVDAAIQAVTYNFTLHPDDPNAILWMGRWYGFDSRFNDAIAVFTRGAEMFPNDPQFLRHRGHRYLSTRQFDKAAADFEKAASLVAGKPDQDEISGIPGAKPSSLGTLKYNLFYHMGVTYFVKGDFAKSLAAFQETAKYINGDEARIPVIDWQYMALRRLGRSAEAKALVDTVPDGLHLGENDYYYQIVRMYKGVIKPEQLLSADGDGVSPEAKARHIATQGYALGNFYLVEGQPQKAREAFLLVTAGTEWAAFGFIAAEADLIRLGKAGK